MSALTRTSTEQSHKSHRSTNSGPNSDPKLHKTATFDPLAGVLNHLSEAQEQKLVQFKARLEKEGWWSPNGVNGKPTHDDGTLLRYLRARKFDVNGAYGQFTDTEKWLKEQHVEELYENFDVETYETARKMYPQWTGHRDRRGIPIYVFLIKGLDSKNVSHYQKMSDKYKKSLPIHSKLSTPAKLLPLFALYHNLLNFVLPMVSTLERPHTEVPVTNSTNIVDISGVGLTQFWNLKAHMQDASVLATAHYPETLDRIFIIGAPAFFPTVWSWIKRWFDPVTVSKIFILSKSEIKPTLSKYMDPKDIPKKYGGELDWQWGDLPHLDDVTREALERDGNKGWIKGPTLWLENQRVAVGSVDGKPRAPGRVVEEKKPVLYAADYTEVPVHENKRRSTLVEGGVKDEKTAQPNGTANLAVAPAAAVATTAAAIPEATRTEVPAVTQSAEQPPAASTSNTAAAAASTAAAAPQSTRTEAPTVTLPAEQPSVPSTQNTAGVDAYEATKTSAPAPVAQPASVTAQPTAPAPPQAQPQPAPAGFGFLPPATSQDLSRTGPITAPPTTAATTGPFQTPVAPGEPAGVVGSSMPQTSAPAPSTTTSMPSFYSMAATAAPSHPPTTTAPPSAAVSHRVPQSQQESGLHDTSSTTQARSIPANTNADGQYRHPNAVPTTDGALGQGLPNEAINTSSGNQNASLANGKLGVGGQADESVPALQGKESTLVERPTMERFITAAEF